MKIFLIFLTLNSVAQPVQLPISVPVKQYSISSNFGDRIHPITGERKLHNGIDLTAGKEGFLVYNLMPGRVIEIDYKKTSGTYVKINHGSYESVYAHLEHVYVAPGTWLEGGKIIGRMGETGQVTGKHLHFAVKRNGKYIDPKIILDLIEENQRL